MKLVCLGEQDESAQRGAKHHMIAEETVIEALSYLVDSLHYPVLVMCSTGKHRTGEQCVISFSP
jgi:protein tyrosine/serine phosphatase